MMAAWTPAVDAVATVVLGSILTSSIVAWHRITRRRARSEPGHLYQRVNTTTGAVSWRAIDGAGRRSRRFRSKEAARRWLDRRQGNIRLLAPRSER